MTRSQPSTSTAVVALISALVVLNLLLWGFIGVGYAIILIVGAL